MNDKERTYYDEYEMLLLESNTPIGALMRLRVALRGLRDALMEPIERFVDYLAKQLDRPSQGGEVPTTLDSDWVNDERHGTWSRKQEGK